jgi:hypothetical protein
VTFKMDAVSCSGCSVRSLPETTSNRNLHPEVTSQNTLTCSGKIIHHKRFQFLTAASMKVIEPSGSLVVAD